MSLAAQCAQINQRLEIVFNQMAEQIAARNTAYEVENRAAVEEATAERIQKRRDEFLARHPREVVNLPGVTAATGRYLSEYDILLMLDKARRKREGDNYRDPTRGSRNNGLGGPDLRFGDNMVTIDVPRFAAYTDPITGERVWGVHEQQWKYDETLLEDSNGNPIWKLGEGIWAVDAGSIQARMDREAYLQWERTGKMGEAPKMTDPLSILWGQKGGIDNGEPQDRSFSDRLRDRDMDPKWWDHDEDYNEAIEDCTDRDRALSDFFEQLFSGDSKDDWDWFDAGQENQGHSVVNIGATGASGSSSTFNGGGGGFGGGGASGGY